MFELKELTYSEEEIEIHDLGELHELMKQNPESVLSVKLEVPDEEDTEA